MSVIFVVIVNIMCVRTPLSSTIFVQNDYNGFRCISGSATTFT